MHKVYILQSLNFAKTYVGMTGDLEKRLEEHNSGKSTFTKRFLPWKVIYSEECVNIQEARKKEKYFKSHTGRNKIREIINNCRIV